MKNGKLHWESLQCFLLKSTMCQSYFDSYFILSNSTFVKINIISRCYQHLDQEEFSLKIKEVFHRINEFFPLNSLSKYWPPAIPVFRYGRNHLSTIFYNLCISLRETHWDGKGSNTSQIRAWVCNSRRWLGNTMFCQ